MGGRANGCCEGRDTTRGEKRERKGGGRRWDTMLGVSYAKTGPHFYRDSLSKQGQETRDEKRKGEGEREREEEQPRHNSFSSVFPSFRSQYSIPSPPPTLGYSRTSRPPPLVPTFSNLPAARYRLPNKLTECSALRYPRVLVSFLPESLPYLLPLFALPRYFCHATLTGPLTPPQSRLFGRERNNRGSIRNWRSNFFSFLFFFSPPLRRDRSQPLTGYNNEKVSRQKRFDGHLPRLPDGGLPASPPSL